MVTHKQLNFYEDNGYLHIEGLLESDLILALQHKSKQLIERLQKHAPIPQEGVLRRAVFRESVPKGKDVKEGAVYGVMDLQDYDPIFTKLLFYEPLILMIKKVLGTSLKLHHTRLITKGAELNNAVGEGSDFGMHQDYPFFPHLHHSTLAAWIPLIDTSLENGTLHVVPGSHKLGPIEHSGSPENGFRLNQDEWPISRGIPVIAKARDVILFNYLMVHGSNQNKSNKQRTALIYQFNASTEEPLNSAHHDSSGNGMLLM